jgi:hypothetical protein
LLAALAGSIAAAGTEAASAALVAEAASTALKGAWGKPGPTSAAEAPGAGVDPWLQALRLATAANKATRRSDFFIAIPFEDNDEKSSRRVLESWNRTALEPITKQSAFYLTGCTVLPAQVEIVRTENKNKAARRRLLIQA